MLLPFFCSTLGVSYEIIEALIGTSAEIVRDHYSSFGMDKLKHAINALPRRDRTLTTPQENHQIDVIDELQSARSKIIHKLNSIDDLAQLEQIYNFLEAKEINM